MGIFQLRDVHTCEWVYTGMLDIGLFKWGISSVSELFNILRCPTFLTYSWHAQVSVAS